MRRQSAPNKSGRDNCCGAFVCDTATVLDIAAAAELAGYRIEERVGRGGSADVYRAVQLDSGQLVALKVLSVDADPRLVDREVQLLQGIEHPGVVELIDTGKVGEQRFVATRWVDGPTLARVLVDDAPLAPVRAMRVFRQIANALAAVHDAGVVHGDLTPANIIVGEADVVTLVDFGIGRSGEVATITLDADMSGTPRYLAPEVIEGGTPTAASDQYSAAIVLYEMLTSRWPFPDEGTVATVLHHQLMTLPTPLREVDAWLPATAEEAVDRALRKAPDERFGSITAFANALGDAGRARAPGAGRTKNLLVGLSALAVLVAAVAGWAVLRGTGETDPVASAASPQTGAAEDTDAARIAAAQGDGAEGATDDVGVEPSETDLTEAPDASEAARAPEDSGATGQPDATDELDATDAGVTEGAQNESADPESDADTSTDTEADAEVRSPLLAFGVREGDGSGYLSAAWVAGTAAAQQCNLLTATGFEDGRMPEFDWVQPPDIGPDIEISRILPNGGVDDSFSVEVGSPNSWGAYSEVAEVEPDRIYFASLMGRTVGDTGGSLGLTWIDSDFQAIIRTDTVEIIGETFGQAWLLAAAPPNAAWASVEAFKNAGNGQFVIDEILLAEGDAACVKELGGP